MGNSSSKDSQTPPRARHAGEQNAPSGAGGGSVQLAAGTVYGNRNGSGRGSRHDLFLSLGRGDRDVDAVQQTERPRETKQEKEARRAERERQARLKERERSMQEEHVDGGYLVTTGIYTGAEDFNKGIVRQVQIERRLAPFWKGLNDHSESWTEAQLVAAVRGLPIPAADEVPPDMVRSTSQALSSVGSSEKKPSSSLGIPIASRSQSYQHESNLSASHPAFSTSVPASPNGSTSTSPMAALRSRSKTLATLATGSKSHPPDMTPREIRLPDDPNINGLPIEAYLYREVLDCPICFNSFPPFLNRTRCCDQPLCSECFVQHKRPDPHPPEHEQPGQPRPPEEEAEMLVSEPATCPFCKTPEFGVSYEPPPFRRGQAYANCGNHPLRNPTSAMSSSISLASGGANGRRRAMSLSANAPQVVSTDKIRPDWAKKLADARAHALRRSAAASALHNAAYVLNNTGDGQRGALVGFTRRRRTLFGDSPSASGSGTPRQEGITIASYRDLMGQTADQPHNEDGSADLFGGRSSSRRNRVEDLEELMMMEAIRLSLAAEEERKKKDEKEASKNAKKEKRKAEKEEKKARKSGLYLVGTNDSTSTYGSAQMARSTSNLGDPADAQAQQQQQGKGKQPIAQETSDPQRHLEKSRAHLQPSATLTPVRSSPVHIRHLSNASSAASSFVDSNNPSNSASGIDISNNDDRSGTPPVSEQPLLNYRSLAAMVGKDEEGDKEHIEHAAPPAAADVPVQTERELKEPSPVVRGRGDSGESSSGSSGAALPVYGGGGEEEGKEERHARLAEKEYGEQTRVVERGGGGYA